MPNKQKFSTKLIHQGESFSSGTGAVISPIYATSTFEQGNSLGFDYTRSGNPNFRNLEQTLLSIEDAKFATVFSSGVAAITAVVSNLKAGDLIIAEENVYGCTYRLFEQVLSRYNIKAEYLDFTKAESLETLKSKKPALVWLESPTNPLLKLIDIEKISKASASVSAPVIVDNTFASSYLQLPLELGATLSLTSTTKFINGHSDALGGVVCTNDAAWEEKLKFSQKALGLNPSPFDAWLISRGLKTFSLRMDRHSENALFLAKRLESFKTVKNLRYPFLESHPQHELAKKQMSAGSGLIVMEVDFSKEETLSRLKSLEYFTLAESLGGVESLSCHPATMTHASVPKNVREEVGIKDSLIRLSVGIEDKEDLLAALEKSFL